MKGDASSKEYRGTILPEFGGTSPPGFRGKTSIGEKGLNASKI